MVLLLSAVQETSTVVAKVIFAAECLESAGGESKGNLGGLLIGILDRLPETDFISSPSVSGCHGVLFAIYGRASFN